jgi:type VII secretion-associated serine protease mycosin
MEPKQVRLRKLLALVLTVAGVLFAAQPASADEIRDREYWLTDYSFKKAWNLTKGKGVRVAVIDTGVDATHVDLKNVVVDGEDFSGLGDINGTTPVGASNYHGTMVAGLIAGRGHGNSKGVIGTAPEASLISASLAFGVDGINTDDEIAQAIYWSVDHGASVINLSLSRSSAGWPESWDAAFGYAFDHDVVVVAAAGNRSSGTDTVAAPATIPGVLAVAGVDRNGKASREASTTGLTIGVSAPADELIGVYPGGDYRVWSGTSGAAPIVSGLVALVRAYYPELDANNVINRVIKTADKQTEESYSPLYGYGLIDPLRALTASVEPVTENPLGSLDRWVELYRASGETTDVSGESGIHEPLPQDSLGETIEGKQTDNSWIATSVFYGVLGIGVIFSVARRLRRNILARRR